MSAKERQHRYTTLHKDLETLGTIKSTPQTESPVYRLAFEDDDFLRRDDLRGLRLMLEMEKAQKIQDEHDIRSTVVMFGGARLPEPGVEPWAAKNEAQRIKLKENSKYYAEARKFAERVSQESLKHENKEFVVVTGGGPGVMEAGNRGAMDAKAKSIGLGIVLKSEPLPNAYISPELCFNFHYFAIRKMHFLMRAKAVTVFPGGFGTLDELFETLTLIQTGRMEPVPIILFHKEFWQRIINFEAIAEEGTISPGDLDLFQYAETAEDGWKIIADFYGL